MANQHRPDDRYLGRVDEGGGKPESDEEIDAGDRKDVPVKQHLRPAVKEQGKPIRIAAIAAQPISRRSSGAISAIARPGRFAVSPVNPSPLSLLETKL